MEFGLSKCEVLIMKTGKLVKTEGKSMHNGKVIKNIEEGGYKYLEILEDDSIKQEEMKGQIKKESTRSVKNILKSKLNGWNIISTINSKSVSIVKSGAVIICCTKMKLEELDRKTRKLVTMEGAQQPIAAIDGLYLQRCDGGGGLIGQEDCVQVEVDSLSTLEMYLSSSNEKMLKTITSMEEVKKKYIKNIVKITKANLFMDSLKKLQRK